MDQPPLRLVYGAGDVIALLDDMKARALRGEVEVLGVAFAGPKGLFNSWAWVDDCASPWARLMASSHAMCHDLMVKGL